MARTPDAGERACTQCAHRTYYPLPPRRPASHLPFRGDVSVLRYSGPSAALRELLVHAFAPNTRRHLGNPKNPPVNYAVKCPWCQLGMRFMVNSGHPSRRNYRCEYDHSVQLLIGSEGWPVAWR